MMDDFQLPEDLDDADDLVWELLSASDLESIVETLNGLVLSPGHRQHQAVVKRLQSVASPSSIPVLRQALASGFDLYDYTCSDDEVIAKWFSWALFAIGTKEAKAVLTESAQSDNPDVAKEMKYRLAKWP